LTEKKKVKGLKKKDGRKERFTSGDWSGISARIKRGALIKMPDPGKKKKTPRTTRGS